MSSQATLNTQNFLLSPMIFKFGGIDLGATDGGVQVSVKTKTAQKKADQTGDTPLGEVVVGQDITLKAKFAEVKDLSKWKMAFPYGKLITSGGKTLFMIDNQVGVDLFNFADTLSLHPQEKDTSDKSFDINWFKAVAKAASTISFDASKQSVLDVEFQCVVDFSTLPARYMTVGDPTVGLVAATFTQSAYTGTGNGTSSGLSAGSKAVTENVTARCIAVAGGVYIFEVIGSVSGPLGNATAGTPFTSQHGNFTITDGATHFVLNDEFTFASVAANYA